MLKKINKNKGERGKKKRKEKEERKKKKEQKKLLTIMIITGSKVSSNIKFTHY